VCLYGPGAAPRRFLGDPRPLPERPGRLGGFAQNESTASSPSIWTVQVVSVLHVFELSPPCGPQPGVVVTPWYVT